MHDVPAPLWPLAAGHREPFLPLPPRLHVTRCDLDDPLFSFKFSGIYGQIKASG